MTSHCIQAPDHPDPSAFDNSSMREVNRSPVEQEPATILFVEDHTDTRRVVQLALQRRGYRVLTAECVAAAREMIHSSHFDLLLSDIGLPDGTGHEIMEMVRRTLNVPGIALSGFGMEEDIRASLNAGFLSHLVKPVRSALLFATIAQAIGRAVG